MFRNENFHSWKVFLFSDFQLNIRPFCWAISITQAKNDQNFVNFLRIKTSKRRINEIMNRVPVKFHRFSSSTPFHVEAKAKQFSFLHICSAWMPFIAGKRKRKKKIVGILNGTEIISSSRTENALKNSLKIPHVQNSFIRLHLLEPEI